MRSSKITWLVAIGLLGFMVAACSVAPTPPNYVPERPMTWYSLSEAQMLSQQTGKPILILLYGHNCPYCHQMLSSTMVNPAVQSYVEERLIPVMATSAEAPQLFHAWSVDSIPTTVIVAPDGQRMSTMPGYRTSARFLGQLKDVVGP